MQICMTLIFYYNDNNVVFFQGVGKSMTIRTVANHAENLLREPGGDIRKPRVLLCAFTAKASNLISKCFYDVSFLMINRSSFHECLAKR